MAFPADLLDVRAHLFYDATWNDITSDVRGITADSGGGVTVRRGRADESGRVTPTRCNVVLSSPNGEYNPRVPTSSLFGKIGRNTPLRVSVGEPHVGAADDSTSASTSHVAPSVTAASAGLLVCAWAGDLGNYTAPGGMTEQAETDSTLGTMSTATEAVTSGATGTRTATSSVSSMWTAVSAVLHGSSVSVEEVLSGGAVHTDVDLSTASGTQAGWWLVAVHHWAWDDGELTQSMPVVPFSDEGGWILLAESDETLFSTRRRRMRIMARRVERAGAQTERFRIPEDASSTHRIDNQAHLLVLSGVDDWHVRATVEVPSWPQRWEVSGNDGWVPVSGAGILRRLGQDTSGELSPIYRRYTQWPVGSDYRPMAYWPMEDGTLATRLGSAIGNQSAGVVDNTNVTLSSDDTLAGSRSLPVVGVAADVYAVRFHVSGHSPSSGWALDWLMKTPEPSSVVTVPIMELSTTGDAAAWQLQWRNGDLRLVAVDDTGSAVDSLTMTPTDFAGEWVHVRVSVSSSGNPTVNWQRVGESSSFGGTDPSFAVTDPGRIRRVTLGTGGGDPQDVSIGHLAVFEQSTFTTATLRAANNGWQGETAGNRIIRLCDELDLPLAFVGDPDDTVAMGVQSATNLTALLRECETADLGVLYEPREVMAVGYRARTTLYNQGALLALTYGDAGEVVPPLHPEPDEQLLVNDVTVSRSGGSGTGASYHTRKDDGPLAVDEIGIYPDTPSVNVASDLDLPNQGEWRLHLGTVDEDRFPVVSVDLAALGNAGKTSLLTDAQVVDLGDRLTIDSPPGFVPPDDIDQLVQGYREQFGQFVWRMELNCSPSSPWRVLVWQAAGSTPAADDPAFFVSESATLDEALDTTETGVDIDCGAGSEWSHETDFDIVVGGERMTVTAVGSATGTFPARKQTLTVTRSVNGVVKSHASGDGIKFVAAVPYAL